MTTVDFYLNRSQKYLAAVKSEIVPRQNEIVNLSGIDFKVVEVRWCVDWASDALKSELRAVVELKKVREE